MKLRLVTLTCTMIAVALLVATPAHAQYNPNFLTLSTTVVTDGQSFGLTGGYFDAGSNVTAVFTSTPVTLGLLVAGNDGVVSGTFTVPAGAVLGAHTVHLEGVRNGLAVQVSAALEVVAAGQAVPTVPGPGAGSLPVTGSSNVALYTAGGAGLIVAGAALVGVTRRRRQVPVAS